MKQTILSLATLGLLLSGTAALPGQTNQTTTKTMETKKTTAAKAAVHEFFTAFGKGDFNGIVNSFHDSCTIIGIRDAGRSGNQVYGTYKGKEGVKAFISSLGNTFDTKAFSVDQLISEGSVAFASGKFTHVVKATGKPFSSDWALKCIVKDEKILEYHFYEDSEKFAEASR